MEDDNEIRKRIATRDELMRLRPNFLPEITQGDYFDEMLSNLDKRPFRYLDPSLPNHQGMDLGLCDSCRIIYQVNPSFDLMMVEKDGKKVPYCERCAASDTVHKLFSE